MDRRDATSSTSAQRRCVVWLPCDTAVPAALLAAMGARGISVTIAVDGPAVMWELAGDRAVALVVVEPAGQAHLEDLLDAVRYYHPRVGLWQYRPGQPQAGGGLTRLNGSPSAVASSNGHGHGGHGQARPTAAAEPAAGDGRTAVRPADASAGAADASSGSAGASGVAGPMVAGASADSRKGSGPSAGGADGRPRQPEPKPSATHQPADPRWRGDAHESPLITAEELDMLLGPYGDGTEQETPRP